jgi:hypothetical protein
MPTRYIPRWAVAALLTIPAFGAGLAVSAAASGSPSTTFYACLHNGSLSKVSTSSHSCKSHYKAVRWDAVGPQGLQGVQGVQGPKGDAGARGPDSLSALAGTPCTFDGQASTLALAQSSLTGAVSLSCQPVPLPFSATVSGATMSTIAMFDGIASQHQCLNASSCSFTFNAGDNLTVDFFSGSVTTGGGSPFTASCPGGWTGSGAAVAHSGSSSGTYYLASCQGTAVTASTASTAAFISFSAAVTGGAMGEILLTDQSTQLPMCTGASSCGPFTFAAGDNLSVLFLSGRLDTGGGSTFTASCPAGWSGSGAAVPHPGSSSGIYYVATCTGTAVTVTTTSSAAF